MRRTLVVVCLGISSMAAPVLWAQQRAGGPPAAQKGTGIILGQIVDGTTGRPVPDAVVTLGFGRGLPAASRGTPALVNQPIITGADGRFVFRDLAAGRIPITVTASGYIDSNAAVAGGARPVELADGERIADLKIRLWKYAVVSGTVVDESGEPAVGVTVRATRRPGPGQRVNLDGDVAAQTDDRGAYRISTLKPGEYLIVLPQTQSTVPAKVLDQMMNILTGGPPPMDLMDIVSSGVAIAPGMGVRLGDLLWTSSYSGTPAPALEGRMQTYTTVFHPGVTTPAEATVVTLKSGEERSGVDVQLRLVPTARVTGTVVGPKGPVANAGVRLVPVALQELSGGFGSDLDTAEGVTRADGTFTLIGVPPGQYVATVTKRPSESMMQMFTEAVAGRGRGPAAPTLYAQTPITVGGADVSAVMLTLHEGAKVSGRVDFDGASPRPSLEGATGRGLSVRLVSLTGGVGGGLPEMQEPPGIDPSGKFTTVAYAPGRYRLMVIGRVVGQSGSAWESSAAMLDGHDILVEPFELGETNIEDVVLTLTDRWGSLRGTVTTGTAPARTATVALVPADVTAWIASGMPTLRTRLIPASRSGAYTMPQLKPGDYLVAALDDADVGELQDPRFAQAVARVATRVTIGPGEVKTLDLQVVKVTR